MADIEKNELIRQFKVIADFMEDTELKALVMEDMPDDMPPTLLIGLADEIKDGHYIVCNLMPMDEEDAAYTNFLHMFYEIPYETSSLNELDLLRAVNAMNTVMVIGGFICNRISEDKARVQLRLTLTADVEEVINPSTVCECACMILNYASTMEEIVSGLLAGMDLDTILEAEELTGEE